MNLLLAKELTNLNPFHQVPDVSSKDVVAARMYIREYWQSLVRFHPKSDDSRLGLPKPYLIESFATEGFDYDELYYWDSYFMAQGLLDAEHQDLTEGMLEDLLSLFKRYKVIPNASRTYLTGRSQPPFLTSYIFDVYEAFHKDNAWLEAAMKIARQEYRTVWMGTRKPNDRLVYRGLSRYYDINMLHDLAEAESGWDMTPRFDRKALHYIPVDLNALLYKYESDFAWAAEIKNKPRAAAAWRRKAEARKATMNELMWDRISGMFYDYDYERHHRGNINSLAAFYPMWAGMVDEYQAAALVRSLRRFENKGGLTTTDSQLLTTHLPSRIPMQWAYPNGWAPLHFIVVKALERYGYHADARRIALKWLRCNLRWFRSHGEFLEKYNVVNINKMPVQGVYPTQKGFGWTNAVFERFCLDYLDHDRATASVRSIRTKVTSTPAK